MKLGDAYNIVSRMTDTVGQAIDVTETKRVLAVYHAFLASLSPSEAMDIVSKGVAEAEKKKGASWEAVRKKLKSAIKRSR